AGAEHEARLAAAEAGERATYKDEAAGGEAAPGAAPVTPISEVAGAGSQVAEELGLDVSVVEAAMAEVVEPGEEEEEVRARETAASYRSVDELFARIRAERAAGAAEVAEDAPPGAAEDVPAGDVPAGDVPAEEVPAEDVPAEEEIAAVGEVVVGASEGPVGADEAGGEEPRGEDDAAYGEEPVSASDYGHLGRRSELLDPLTVKLSRALKRALQDDQNELLTALRNSAGAPNLANLLPEADQKARYTAATLELLGEAWSLGLGWLSGGGQDQDGSVAPPGSTEQGPAAAGTTLASELANELSGLLRRRMVEALETVDDTANGAAGDAASAAYREWKGQRVEALAGDFTTRAFGRGAVAGGKGLSVRWIADDQGAPCSDCDDNVLAGEQQVGEAFPTGQLHPPVHPGCRCLIVAANL
ncbi:MAG: hypothetical protein ACRDZ5_11785, partial [Acidimicrobiales bacterium]